MVNYVLKKTPPPINFLLDHPQACIDDDFQGTSFFPSANFSKKSDRKMHIDNYFLNKKRNLCHRETFQPVWVMTQKQLKASCKKVHEVKSDFKKMESKSGVG